MKKFFSYFGIFSLLLVSFFYTERTVNVVKEYDDVMIEIKEYSSNNKKEPVNALISDNTIIPGIKGYQVDINKSYSKMKKYGKFDSSLIEYENINPSISLCNNFDKYIVQGNPENRMVSLIFLVNNEINIDSILSILDKNKVKGNFFVSNTWLENNSDKIISLINDGHIIGNLSNNSNYLDSSFLWMDTIIKKVGKQENGYCYFEEENKDELDICSIYGNYSIKPTIISIYPYKEVKEKLASGSILSFSINNELISNLDIIISYIKSKGLIIVNLNEIIKE